MNPNCPEVQTWVGDWVFPQLGTLPTELRLFSCNNSCSGRKTNLQYCFKIKKKLFLFYFTISKDKCYCLLGCLVHDWWGKKEKNCWPCMLSFGWKVWYIRRYEVEICLFKIILVKVKFSRKNVSKWLGGFVRGLLTSRTIFLLNEMTCGSATLLEKKIKKQCVKWLKAKSMNFGILHSAVCRYYC